MNLCIIAWALETALTLRLKQQEVGSWFLSYENSYLILCANISSKTLLSHWGKQVSSNWGVRSGKKQHPLLWPCDPIVLKFPFHFVLFSCLSVTFPFGLSVSPLYNLHDYSEAWLPLLDLARLTHATWKRSSYKAFRSGKDTTNPTGHICIHAPRSEDK